MLPLLWLVLLAALAFVVGIVGSLAGLVLGNIRLPVLLALLPAAVAGGTNITVSGAGAGAGAVTHLREGRFDRPAFLIMTPPSVVGAVLGGLLAADVPGSLLVLLVAGIVLEQGTELLWSRFHATADEHRPGAPSRGLRWGLFMAAAGFLIGVLGGLVGLILGTIRLPAMLRGGLTAKDAVGTNLAVGFFVGIAGLAGHLITGTVDPLLVGVMAPPAVIGAVGGAKFAGRFTERGLRGVIGVILLAVGGILIAFLLLGVTYN